ncbi:MAG: glycosyltransferase family 1 protein, partial [Candidatus Buchananbacteria bacterium]
MKIGVDIRCLMESRYSGISEYAYNLLKALFEIDTQNQYFLFYNKSKSTFLPAFKKNNVFLKGFHYPNKLFNLAMKFFKIAEVDKMIGGVDVFLIPNFLFLNLSADCKKLLIVHDLSFDLYPEFFTAKRRLWHRLIGPKNFCLKADKIVAISENTKNDIIKLYGVKENKIVLINPGISELFFTPVTEAAKSEARQKFCLPKNYIFYLGNLEPRKNVESLILAFEKVKTPDMHLVIAGSLAWKYNNIKKIWENSALKDKIKFLGYVAAEDKPALYAMAKVFVYPSIYEGFGLPPVESMACGTPVITGFNSSLIESVADAGLLIDQNNINEIAQSIDLVLNDEKLRNNLKIRSQAHAQKFHWLDKAQEILNV